MSSRQSHKACLHLEGLEDRRVLSSLATGGLDSYWAAATVPVSTFSIRELQEPVQQISYYQRLAFYQDRLEAPDSLEKVVSRLPTSTTPIGSSGSSAPSWNVLGASGIKPGIIRNTIAGRPDENPEPLSDRTLFEGPARERQEPHFETREPRAPRFGAVPVPSEQGQWTPTFWQETANVAQAGQNQVEGLLKNSQCTQDTRFRADARSPVSVEENQADGKPRWEARPWQGNAWFGSKANLEMSDKEDNLCQLVVLPQEAGLATGPLGGEDTLDLALQQFLSQLDDMGRELSRALADHAWVTWLMGASMGIAALDLSRRQARRWRSRLALAGTGPGTTLEWTPGLPGPFTSENP